MNAREKRGLVADFVTQQVLSSIKPEAHHVPGETHLIVGKFQEDGKYWSGMLHKFVLDLVIGGTKKGWHWRVEDRQAFDDAWSMMDSSHNVKEEYEFSRLLYEHLGIERDFFRRLFFGGLETCGIITDRLDAQSTIQSQVLSQWEAEVGSS